MPWTLYRHVLKDLLRLLVLTSAVLIVLMSVAAAVPYIADGLLGPVSMAKFIGYMCPTMLSLALPFAGAFVGTLIFNRMVTDNEVLICRACGLNYMLILLPVGFLGAALMAGMFYMSNWLIPDFYERAEHTLEKDIVSLVVRRVQNGEPLEYDDLLIYADAAAEGEPPPMATRDGVEPKRVIALRGVVVAKINEEGRLTEYGTAKRADMLLYHTEDDSLVMLRLVNARYFGNEDTGGQGTMAELPLGPFELENPYRQRLRFFSWGELSELKRKPERDRRVKRAKKRLVRALAREQTVATMEQRLGRGSGKLTLLGTVRGERFVIRAPNVKRHPSGLELSAAGDTGGNTGGEQLVRIEQFVHGVLAARRYHARRAIVTVDAEQTAEPRMSIRLFNLHVIDSDAAGEGTERQRLRLPLMRLPEPIVALLSKASIYTLLDMALNNYADVEEVNKAAAKSIERIGKMRRRTIAQYHERASTAVGCMMMVLLGAVMAMKMEGRLPLVVYFWTFLLAVTAIIVTRTGVRLVDGPGLMFYTGMAVIWSGNLIVGAAILMSYWRLERT